MLVHAFSWQRLRIYGLLCTYVQGMCYVSLRNAITARHDPSVKTGRPCCKACFACQRMRDFVLSLKLSTTQAHEHDYNRTGYIPCKRIHSRRVQTGRPQMASLRNGDQSTCRLLSFSESRLLSYSTKACIEALSWKKLTSCLTKKPGSESAAVTAATGMPYLQAGQQGDA